MPEDLVSIIVPVYNGQNTLEATLESAFAQRIDRPFEVIVIDDGSTDATPRVISAYEGRIRTPRLEGRCGPAAARNAGVAMSRGSYLAFLDADDVWLPGFLDKTLRALTDSPASVLAFADVVPLDDRGVAVEDFVDSRRFDGTPTLEDLLTRWWPILTSAVVMRREVFERCGGFPEEFRLPGYEDPWLWIRAREHGSFERVNEPLVLYRTTAQPERIEKYESGFEIFARLATERYGAAGRALVKHYRRSHVNALGYRGLLAMSRGDYRAARREFRRALRFDPFSTRTILRMARTFMPERLALMMTGRTRRLHAQGNEPVLPARKRFAPE